MDYIKRLVLPADNLLHCVKHDTEDRFVWVFLVDTHNNFDTDGKMQWVLTVCKPEQVGIKQHPNPNISCGRRYVEVKVNEVFTDAGDLLRAERENGFHSHRADSTTRAKAGYSILER